MTARALHAWCLAASALALAWLALVQFTLSVAMLAYPRELMYGESLVYDRARRIVDGAPLYQAWDRLPYTVASYTPLYYWLAAADGRGWPAGAPAGLISLALGAPGSGNVPWTSLYKEDSLALALARASIWLLGRGWRLPALVGGAGVLAALAILAKQTSAPLLLGELAWL